ncbi:MAG: aldo/keto reductase [Patescibacteria group bacterium]
MPSKTHITLNTGARMPIVGLGTWKSPTDKAGRAVEYALTEGGYQHIDCAAIYKNEPEIGQALKKVFAGGTVKRGDVFITSKLWNSAHAKEKIREACEKTLRDLNLEYLDLYLMHWGLATPSHWAIPTNGQEAEYDDNGVLVMEKIPIRETWEAMEELVQGGLVKAIGVANFTAPMLIDVLSYASLPPAMNQIEIHPYFQQTRLIEFCHNKNIAVTAYSPLGSPGNFAPKGFPLVLEDAVIKKIADTHQKTSAQIVIRWALERGTVVIPKSTTPERIKENSDVFNFELSPSEMNEINLLDKKLRFLDPYVWGKIPYFD